MVIACAKKQRTNGLKPKKITVIKSENLELSDQLCGRQQGSFQKQQMAFS
jgi:hypothetical protein